uniref:Zinc metalloproteinase n=1 Tax=Panagrellus redivivus TaxID=6233 RepID=A0A7E4VNW7_PANRE
MTRSAALLISCIAVLALAIVDANEFLRDEEQPVGRLDREPRAAPQQWHASIRRRAVLFGQTPEEIQTVQSYLSKLKNLAVEKHPAEVVVPKTDTKANQDGSKTSDDVAAWNRQRMSDSIARNPEENSELYEGDIVLTADQAESIYQSAVGRSRVKRKFIGSKVRRWDPKKPILFSFDGSHTLREQRVIELALEHWHNITCLNFERRDDEPKGNRIVFTDVDGCASNVGKHPLGEPQFVSLAPECIRLGVIAHEVAHALGFWHEQSRPDRDYYVKVRWENIDRDSKGQFLKEQPSDVDNGGVPYDYGSIMHYRSKAFARFDDLFTMNTFISDYQRTIGQRDQLSFNDIRLMNNIYCRDTCPRRLPCQRGGYTDPRRCDRCRCPDGFTGQYCEQVMPGYGADCGGRVQVTSSWTRVSSPGYPAEFREGQECSWLLVAPPGQHVQLQFFGEFEMYCKVRHSLCMDYVEIRNSTDFANTGMRYCCFGTPEGAIVSATEDMLVLFRSFYRGGKGFQAQVRAIAHTVVAPVALAAAIASVIPRLPIVCQGDDAETEVCNRTPCRGVCSRKRTEDGDCTGFLSLIKGIRCKIEKMYLEDCDEVCCAGYTKINGLCTR